MLGVSGKDLEFWRAYTSNFSHHAMNAGRTCICVIPLVSQAGLVVYIGMHCHRRLIRAPTKLVSQKAIHSIDGMSLVSFLAGDFLY